MYVPFFTIGTGPGKVIQLFHFLPLLVPAVQQLQKYTPENLKYYFMYAVGVRSLPLDKLKFLDEAHFVPSHLLKGKFIYYFLI